MRTCCIRNTSAEFLIYLIAKHSLLSEQSALLSHWLAWFLSVCSDHYMRLPHTNTSASLSPYAKTQVPSTARQTVLFSHMDALHACTYMGLQVRLLHRSTAEGPHTHSSSLATPDWLQQAKATLQLRQSWGPATSGYFQFQIKDAVKAMQRPCICIAYQLKVSWLTAAA